MSKDSKEGDNAQRVWRGCYGSLTECSQRIIAPRQHSSFIYLLLITSIHASVLSFEVIELGLLRTWRSRMIMSPDLPNFRRIWSTNQASATTSPRRRSPELFPEARTVRLSALSASTLSRFPAPLSPPLANSISSVGYIVLSHQLPMSHLNLEFQLMKDLSVSSTSQIVLLHLLNYGGSLWISQKHQLISLMGCTLYVELAALTSGMVLQFTCIQLTNQWTTVHSAMLMETF
nr:hypothetical protein Iba_chr01aCG1550 [Ipomoea batatas]